MCNNWKKVWLIQVGNAQAFIDDFKYLKVANGV